MIEKIVEISNIGHFINYKFQGTSQWNGQFKKVNVVYAPNGSGKTTLSTILKSLALNNIELVRFKKTFGTQEPPKVILKEYNGTQLVTLNSSSWSNHNLQIEVFDINYIEDYLFAGSYTRKQNKTNLFRLLMGDLGLQYRDRMKFLISRQKNLKKKLKISKDNESIQNDYQKVVSDYEQLEKEFDNYTNTTYDIHIRTINKYLAKFVSYITLTEFSYLKSESEYEKFRIYPVFNVYNESVIFSAPDPNKGKGNARYSMSEGDKSAIALSFFLARLEIQGVNNKVIVFDDPLSSFDYSRRNSTIFQLSKIANSAVQFFLLTHDLNFANDFVDKCSFLDCLTLKIGNNGSTATLNHYDIKSEFLTSTQKDIETVKRYLKNGASEEYDKREVIRCIRPIIEGVIKSKYFDVIPNNIWLGEIIESIKKSQHNSRIYRLNTLIEDIIELNDYTKTYHHSTNEKGNSNIDSQELKRYITLLIDTIDKI